VELWYTHPAPLHEPIGTIHEEGRCRVVHEDPAAFGKITSTRDLQDDQREGQLALKFYF